MTIDLEALREISFRFKSGNSVPVERAYLRTEEWQAIYSELITRRARDAEVEALVAADLELNRAIEAAGGFVEEGYESESYGVYGSDFERCLACDAESGAGVLNKGVTHEADCVRHRYEVALERRAEALAPFTGAKP